MPEPTPEEIDALQAELAALRVSDPMPPEVVARLEGALSRLDPTDVRPTAGPPDETGEPDATVVPFRRRAGSRRWVGGAVAAAAVVAALAGASQLGGGHSTPAAESGTSALAPNDDNAAPAHNYAGSAGSPDAPTATSGSGKQLTPTGSTMYDFTSGPGLAGQLRASRMDVNAAVPAPLPCTVTGVPGTPVGASLDGRPALLFWSTRDGVTTGRLVLCGERRPVRVVRVPAG